MCSVPQVLLGLLVAAGLSGASAATAAPVDGTHPPSHRMGGATEEVLKIEQVIPAPDHFVGNVAYDRESGRLWLVSFGPPANTRGSSAIYELDPSTGRVLAKASLPFRGEFATAPYLGGHLYQVVPHESTLYKVAASRDASFGAVKAAVPLPTLNDLKPDDGDVYRFPFMAVTAVAVKPDGNLLLYAADLGELMTLDKDSGAVLRRVKTSKGFTSVTGVPGPGGVPLLLATFDPVESAFRQETRRFMFRASHGILPLETVRQEGNYGNAGQKTVTWALLDPETGELLSSTAVESARLTASSVAFIAREDVPGTRYGRLTALAVAEEGLLKVQWTPK